MKRVRKELTDMANDIYGASVYHLEPEEDDVLLLRGYVMGKVGTPYEGGKFCVKMQVPMNYPTKPPAVLFTTKLWHPNVGATGYVCMDLLNQHWAPTISMATLMLGLQTLLAGKFLFAINNFWLRLNITLVYILEPAFEDPVDNNAPCQLNDNPEAYKKTVAYWTYYFAMSNEKKNDPEIKARFQSYDGKDYCFVI